MPCLGAESRERKELLRARIICNPSFTLGDPSGFTSVVWLSTLIGHDLRRRLYVEHPIYTDNKAHDWGVDTRENRPRTLCRATSHHPSGMVSFTCHGTSTTLESSDEDICQPTESQHCSESIHLAKPSLPYSDQPNQVIGLGSLS